jgi:hypothetical protein
LTLLCAKEVQEGEQPSNARSTPFIYITNSRSTLSSISVWYHQNWPFETIQSLGTPLSIALFFLRNSLPVETCWWRNLNMDIL